MQSKAPIKVGSLLASARRLVAPKNSSTAITSSSTGNDWQSEAWSMYDLVGELRFLSNTLASMVSKAEIFVGHIDPESNEIERLDTNEDTSDDEIANLIRNLGGSDKGLSQILKRLGLNLQIAGEGWLAGVPPLAEDGSRDYDGDVPLSQLEWHMLSVNEVEKIDQGAKVRLSLDSDEKAEFDIEDVHVIRVWNPHPRISWESDSPVRAAMPILKELVGLTMHVSAQVESRLAGAGLLVMPQSARTAIQAANNSSDDGDDFVESLIETMVTPINDRASASAIVPLVVTVPDDMTKNFEYLTFDKPLDTQSQSLREEAIRRFALSQDAPPELLLGTSSMNHWGGWLVKEETINSHTTPPLELICEALTQEFLRPILVEEFGMDWEQASQYSVEYSVDHMVTRPNLGQDARELHQAGVLSDDALRRTNGFDDTDAPEEPVNDPIAAEVLRLVREEPALVGNPGVTALYQQITSLMDGSIKSQPTETPDTESAPEPETTDSDAEDSDSGLIPREIGEAPVDRGTPE